MTHEELEVAFNGLSELIRKELRDPNRALSGRARALLNARAAVMQLAISGQARGETEIEMDELPFAPR